MDLAKYIDDQRDWSTTTFGDGTRTLGITAHIENELAEIRAAPDDLYARVDVIILALDGAWRSGHSPVEIVEALAAKQRINFARQWPPAYSVGQDKPSEHIRDNV